MAGSFYDGVPQNDWFGHYLKKFDTVEINASFYSWPTVAGVQAWRRQPGKKTSSIRSRSASSSPTSRIQGHEDSRQGFWHDLGYPRPPDGLFLVSVASDLSLYQSNVVEFRHASWWNEEVYNALHRACIIFCFCSGPRLPDEFVKTADEIYVRLHGPERWYRDDYSKAEPAIWAGPD